MGTSGLWQKADTVVKIAMEGGKNVDDDRDRLQNLVASLIAKEGENKGEGYQNISLTCISFK